MFSPGETATLMFESVRAVKHIGAGPAPSIRRGQIVTIQRVERYLVHDVCTVEAGGVVAEVVDVYLAPVVEVQA